MAKYTHIRRSKFESRIPLEFIPLVFVSCHEKDFLRKVFQGCKTYRASIRTYWSAPLYKAHCQPWPSIASFPNLPASPYTRL